MTGLMLVLGAAVAAGGSGTSAIRSGEWRCQRSKDGAVVELRAKDDKGTLLVRWTAGRPSISIKWADYGGTRSVLVSAQFDQVKPSVALWSRGVGRREVRYPGDQAAYLRDLAAGKTLNIRLSPEAVRMADASSDGTSDDPWRTTVPHAAGPPVQLTFDLSGLPAAVTLVQSNCGPN
jgi:hypothetical protein